jgi:FkbM family methyltransferase
MKTGFTRIHDIEIVFPIDQRQIEYPDPIVEGIIETNTLDSNGMGVIQLALEPNRVVVDVGCHIGRSSLPLAAYGMHDFILIDGCKNSIKCVKESIKRNDLTNVRAVHAVVSHSNFKCMFAKISDSRNRLGKDIGFWKSLWYHKHARRIRTKTVDQILGDTQCGTLIFDLEGYEMAAIHGAAGVITRDMPNLVVKFKSDYPLQYILDTIYELDYEAYYVQPPTPQTIVPVLAKMQTPCQDCDPVFVVCFPKKRGVPPGISLLRQDPIPTGNKQYDRRELLLEDTTITRYVPLTHNLQES